MRKNTYFLWALIFWGSCSLVDAVVPSITLTICDAAPRNMIYFKSFGDLATAAGYKVEYVSIHDLLDAHVSLKNRSSYNIFLFVITPELLKGINAKHYAATCFTSFIKEVTDHNFFTSFALPSFPSIGQSDLIKLFQSLNAASSIAENNRVHELLNTMPERRPRAYHTTLLPTHMSGLFRLPKHYMPSVGGAYFPLHLPTSAAESVWPVGCLVPQKDGFKGSFITHSSWLTFDGIAENFHMMPLETAALAALNKQMYWTLKDLAFYIHEQRLPLKEAERSDALPLPALCTEKYLEKLRTPQMFASRKVKKSHKGMPSRAAWMDLEAFEEGNAAAMQKHRELIEYLYMGDVGVVWLGISPQWYLGKTAGRKARAHAFMLSVGRFTKLLAEGARNNKKPVPEIFIGFEIANNLKDEHLPKESAVSLYGDVCDDIWAGTNKTFWDEEVIDPFITFMDLWKNDVVSHGLKVRGIVLDCEMYARKKAAEYNSSLCYERSTLADFLGKEAGESSQEALIKEVAARHQFKKYQAFIEKKAEEIGNNIREKVESLCPGALMGCYMAHADLSPFYVGLLRGLGSRHPVDFYTFNVSLEPYKEFVHHKQLRLQHAAVAMLAKFRAPQDGRILSILKRYNQSVWGNRISRLPYFEKGAWFELEQTPLPQKEKQNLMKEWALIN